VEIPIKLLGRQSRVWIPLAAIYVLAGKLGLALAFVNASATAVWPPTGIALAAVLVFGRRVWPGIFLGAFLTNETTAGSVVTSLLIASGNTLEALVGASLVNRFAGGRAAFEQGRDILRFVLLAGFVSTGVSATIGVTTLSLSGLSEWSAYRPTWLTWWLGDASGAVVLAPALLLWTANHDMRWWRERRTELCALVAALVVVGWFVFVVSGYPLTFLCIPICVWAAGRFGQREAATATCLLSLIALWGTVHGFGTFARDSVNDALLLVQAFLVVTSVIGLIVGAAVSRRDVAEENLRRAYAELRMSYQRIRQLAGRLISAQEATRADIARDLHDDVCQDLVGVSLAVRSLRRSSGDIQDAQTQQALTELEDWAIDMVNAVRRLSHELHPPTLSLLGLGSALKAHCLEVEKRHDVQVRFTTDSEFRRLQPEVALYLFRIAQEALRNGAVHGHARQLGVSLAGTGEHVELTVTDDGCGFDVEAARREGRGLGLVSMEERAYVVGGALQIVTRPGQGTTIRVRIPAGARAGAEKGDVHEAVPLLAAQASYAGNLKPICDNAARPSRP
jgi:two-component system, NarL family, sensor histidine kinase FusK